MTETAPLDASAAIISIPQRVAALTEAWKPLELVAVNDTMLRLVRLDGGFPWHQHDEDELFICWEGSFRIELQDAESVNLEPGDVYVVRRGVEHRPVAELPAYTLQAGCAPHVTGLVVLSANSEQEVGFS